MPKGIQIINEDGSERDLSADSTSQEIRDTIGQESGSTVLNKLQGIWNAITDSFSSGLAKVKIWDGNKIASVSAFDILKVAPESQIIGYRWTQDLIDNSFTSDITASGSVGLVESNGLHLQSGASANSGIKFTSNSVAKYNPGIGQMIKISIILGDSGVSGNIREWGMAEDDNGIFIRLNETAYELVIRSNGIETIVPASTWDIPITPDPNGHLWYLQYQWLGVGNFFVYYDEQIVHTHHFLGTSTNTSIESPDLPLRFTNTNTTNNSNIILKNYCVGVFSEGNFIITGLDDTNNLRQVRTTLDGRLLVSTQAPTPPESTTPVSITVDGNVSGIDDNIYIVPSGETLTIQRFSVSAEVDISGGNKIELWYDPLGTGIGMTIIDTIFSSANAFQHDLSNVYLGDGSISIRLRRSRLSGGAKEIYAKWEGYY